MWIILLGPATSKLDRIPSKWPDAWLTSSLRFCERTSLAAATALSPFKSCHARFYVSVLNIYKHFIEKIKPTNLKPTKQTLPWIYYIRADTGDEYSPVTNDLWDPCNKHLWLELLWKWTRVRLEQLPLRRVHHRHHGRLHPRLDSDLLWRLPAVPDQSWCERGDRGRSRTDHFLRLWRPVESTARLQPQELRTAAGTDSWCRL